MINDNHSHLCNYGLWIINYRSPLDNDNHSHSPTQSIIILISVCKCKWQRLSLTFRFVNDNDNDYHLQGPQRPSGPGPRALGTGENGIFARAIVCCDGPTLEVGSVRQWVWHSKWVVWGARGVWNCERRADARGSVRCEVWGVRCEVNSPKSTASRPS